MRSDPVTNMTRQTGVPLPTPDTRKGSPPAMSGSRSRWAACLNPVVADLAAATLGLAAKCNRSGPMNLR